MTQATRLTVLTALLLAVLGAPEAAGACSPNSSILKSPRAGSQEVQAKALNDRGDVVGFADGEDGTFHAILWKRGKAARAVDLGVPRGYVSSEAYGVNNHRVVFGLLYDKKERAFPFRWKDGHMTLLKGPNGRLRQADVPDRNAINERGEIAATLIIAGQRRAVRWTREGKATCSPGAAGTHLDERMEHQRGRRRVRLVAQAAQRRRREQPGALDAIRQGRSR